MTRRPTSAKALRRTRVKASVCVLALGMLLSACSAGAAAPAGQQSGASGTDAAATSGMSATPDRTLRAGATGDEEDGDTGRAVRSPVTATPDGSVAPTTEAGAPQGREPDYAHDAGRTMKAYEYPDDPEPAESVVATLCNLNRDYFETLQPTKDGKAVVDSTLSMAVLGLSDLLDYWDSLRPHYPEVGHDIDVAWAIRDAWDEALLAVENGDPSVAQGAMAKAQGLIEDLPSSSPDACMDAAPGEQK